MKFKADSEWSMNIQHQMVDPFKAFVVVNLKLYKSVL